MKKSIIAANQTFHLESEIPCAMNLEALDTDNGAQLYAFTCSFDQPQTVKNITIRWSEPMLGILSTWTPSVRRHRAVRQWFAPTVNHSSFYRGAPIFSLVDKGSMNHSTVALSDAETPAGISFCVNDFAQQEQVDFCVTLFTEARTVSRYRVLLRIDHQSAPLGEAVGAVVRWWQQLYPQKAPVCAPCEAPLYSSWYNFHQHPNAEKLLPDLKLAAQLGFESVIIDDGWQYDGNGTADYFDCGNWAVAESKFPDFAGFVRDVHKLGMKIMLWFTVPFVGLNTQAYQEFKDRLLYTENSLFRAGVLDPRYPSVREYLINLLRDFVVRYDLDGLKLDFIDSFKLTEDSPAFGPGMDYETVDDSVHRLLDDLMKDLYAVKPECMLEFRQDYVGPAITAYGNMLRVGDCAFDSVTNRIGIADLRMLCSHLAVHSDMLYWAHNETIENCAQQLMNILFSVPQISVMLTESTEEQRRLIARYISYWKENSEILLHAPIRISGSDACYTALSAENASKRIQVLYQTGCAVFDGKDFDLFNGTGGNSLYVENATDSAAKAQILDCMGNEITTLTLNPGVHRIDLPIGGLIQLR